MKFRGNQMKLGCQVAVGGGGEHEKEKKKELTRKKGTIHSKRELHSHYESKIQDSNQGNNGHKNSRKIWNT